jgi:hypothetical protein
MSEIILKSIIPQPLALHAVDVNWADRWQVYQRLKELEIPCWCETNQQLTVEIGNTTAAVQFWSVVQQFTASRQQLIRNLEVCWRKRYQKS